MRLESAFNTAMSAISTFGKSVAVIGDNISNVETTGYKTARSEFSDIMGEVGGSRNGEFRAGGGDGVDLSKVRIIFENGAVEPTNRELDAAIGGKGFFQVGTTDNIQYSRSGNFQINTEGVLTTSDGKPVLGFQGTGTALSSINMYQVVTSGKETSQLKMYGNLSSSVQIVQALPNAATTFRDLNLAASYSVSQSVYDSLGTRRDVNLYFFKTAANTWTTQAYMDGKDVGGTAGVPVKVGTDATVQFDGSGQIAEASKAQAVLTANPPYSGGASAGSFTIDLSNFSQYAGGSIVNQVTQDGLSAANIKSYSFDKDGKIYAELESGDRSQVGALQLATFRNLDGLTREGSGVYSATQEAGTAITGTPGTGQFGTIEGRSLERSTVDVSDQFVNMITIQRGYQANTQTFSKANEMLQQAIGLIR